MTEADSRTDLSTIVDNSDIEGEAIGLISDGDLTGAVELLYKEEDKEIPEIMELLDYNFDGDSSKYKEIAYAIHEVTNADYVVIAEALKSNTNAEYKDIAEALDYIGCKITEIILQEADIEARVGSNLMNTEPESPDFYNNERFGPEEPITIASFAENHINDEWDINPFL